MKISKPMNQEMPEMPAREFLRHFQAEGDMMVMVGGCVRDLLRGITPQDFDFTTPLEPRDVRTRLIQMGYTKANIDLQYERFGLVTVTVGLDTEYEITTFREDVYVPGSRKPMVEFTDDIWADLKRRDFNINSIAWDGENGFYDPYGAINENGTLTDTIVPNKPWNTLLEEDGLRLLRAIRFSARDGYDVDWGDNYSGYYEKRYFMWNVSPQKIKTELDKGFQIEDQNNRRKYIADLMASGFMDRTIPFFDKARYPSFDMNLGLNETWAEFMWLGIYERKIPFERNLMVVMKSLVMMGWSKADMKAVETYLRGKYGQRDT